MNLPELKRKGTGSRLIYAGLLMLLIMHLNCSNKTSREVSNSEQNILNPRIDSRPNILWIVAEDLSPYIPSFGDSTIVTPSLSKLASEGVCYDNFYAPHPVCAPARAAIITGMYANAIGASHMRTGPWFGGRPSAETLSNYQKAMPPGMAPYEAVPPPMVKMFTEYLRKEGYYCTNNSKQDYQFIKTPTAWDESSSKAHWQNRAEGQPFFSVFNIGVTHESQIWSKKEDSLWVDKELKVVVPPYLPDTELARNDIRRMYSNIKEMDAITAEILDELKADGLLENTIIFWYTDHGGPLPRQKRLLYDSGIKVPMIIRFPNAQFAGQRDKRMISFIDLAPTLLSLASIPPPSYMQGTAFLGQHARTEEPEFIFGAADRFDETTDRIRSVRDERFKYIKYYEPEKPMFLEVAYRNQMPVMQELLRLREKGKLTKEQALWFRNRKPQEELFDLWNDRYELNDLSQDPEYKVQLNTMRTVCEEWTSGINDTGLIEESALINSMYPEKRQLTTEQVLVKKSNGSISLTCKTEGASIGFKILNGEQVTTQMPWQLYTKPFKMSHSQSLLVIAHRLGFKPGPTQKWSYEEIP